MPAPRPIARTLAVLLGLLVLAACSDDGETTTAGTGLAMPEETTEVPDTTDPTTTTTADDPEDDTPTTAPPTTPAVDPVVADACEGFAGTLLLPVGTEPPEDDSAMLDAIESLAAEGPEDVRADAEALLWLVEAEEDESLLELPPEELSARMQEGYRAVEAVFAWARDTCDVDGVLWSCAVTSGAMEFETVGEAIEGPDGDAEIVTPTTEPGAAAPEDVYSEALSEGEPVEISRTDDEVVVAWLDEDGHAVEVMTVIDDGGWRSDGIERCDDPTDPGYDDAPTFETIPSGGTVGEDIGG
jgi:hypothetical protein